MGACTCGNAMRWNCSAGRDLNGCGAQPLRHAGMGLHAFCAVSFPRAGLGRPEPAPEHRNATAAQAVGRLGHALHSWPLGAAVRTGLTGGLGLGIFQVHPEVAVSTGALSPRPSELIPSGTSAPPAFFRAGSSWENALGDKRLLFTSFIIGAHGAYATGEIFSTKQKACM